MKDKCLFIVPEFDIKTPRTIRIENIFNNIDVEKKYIAKFNISDKSNKSQIHLKLGWLYIILMKYRLFGLIRRLKKDILLDNVSLFTKSIIKNIMRIVLEKEISTVVIVSYPFSLYKLAKPLRKSFPDLRIIYDIGDPFYFNSNKILIPPSMDKIKFEKNMLNSSSGLIVTNNETRKMYNEFYGFPFEKIEVIPQGVDIDLVNSLSSYSRKEIDKKYKIVYSGIFYPNLRDPNIFFSAIERVDNFEVDIYGSGLKQDIRNINFYERLDQKDLFGKMKCSDVLLFIDNKEGIQTPGKIFEILAFQKNVLFIYYNENSATMKFAKSLESESIIFVKNDKMKILEILNSNILTRINNVNYVPDIFSWNERSINYSKFITKISNV